MATKGIKSWPLSTALMSIEHYSRENSGINLIRPETRVPEKHSCRRQYECIFLRFHMVLPESEAEKNLVKSTIKTDFSIK